MRRLALGFGLLIGVGCVSEADRPWGVQDTVQPGDMRQAEQAQPSATAAPDEPLAAQAPGLASEPERGAADMPDVDGGSSDETASFAIEHSELSYDEMAMLESDAYATDAAVYSTADVPAFELDVPVASLLPRPSETLVRVESIVRSAEVWTDGILLGPANEFLTLGPGNHELEIRASGFAPAYRQITLTPQAKETIKVDLAPLAH